jgi:branched-chain amino acid transport system substrate-binding protein
MIMRTWTLAIALVMSALAMTWPNSGQAQQGLTPNEIVIGAFGPISGPVAYIGIGARAGLELAVSEINQNGGINGRKVRLAFEASGSDPAEFLAAAKKLTESDKAFALVIASGSIGAAAAADYIRERGIIAYNIIAAAPKIHQPLSPNIFHGAAGPAAGYAKITVDQLLSLQPRPKRLAVLVETISYHKSVVEALKPRLQQAGVEIVTIQEFASGDRDFTGQLLAVRRAQPDAVLASGEAPPVAFVMKQAVEAMGMKNLQWIVASSAITQEFPKVGGPAVEGARSTWHNLQYHGEKAGDMPKFEAAWRKLNPNAPVGRPSYLDLAAYNGMYILALAIKNAGKDPTWKSVQAAFESLKDATPRKFGPWAADTQAPENFSSTDHQGNDRLYEVQVTGGQWKVNPNRVFYFEKK